MKDQKEIWNEIYRNSAKWNKETLNLPKIMKDKIVLEIGVGNGKTLKSIVRQKPKKIVAIDISSEAIKISKKLFPNGVEFIEEDINSIDFPRESFDIIVCYYVLNNLSEEDRKKAVEKMHYLLNPAGKILFEDFVVGDFRQNDKGKFIAENTIEKKDGLNCHFFSIEELRSLFSEFSESNIKMKTSTPITNKPELKRKIISGIITR